MLETNDLITRGKEQLKKSMQESFETKPHSKTIVSSRIYQNNLIIDLERVSGHIEDKIIKENLGQIKIFDFSRETEEKFIKNLVNVLENEKMENETNADFEDRITSDLKKIIEI